MNAFLLCFSVFVMLPGSLFAQGFSESSPSRMSQSFNGLRVSPFNVETSRDGQVRVILKLENVSSERGRARQIAVAAKAEYSDGLADFWKFNPVAIARLTDSAGNRYSFNGMTGLQFARTRDDWTTINSDGSIPVTYNFHMGGGGAYGTFNFSAELRVVWLDDDGQSHLGSFQLYFPSLQP